MKPLAEKITCPRCNGTKGYNRPPYWATPMPEDVWNDCKTCNGHGKIIKVNSILPVAI